MDVVAEIAPFGRESGLIVFHCSECGPTDSTLIEPINREVGRCAMAENVAGMAALTSTSAGRAASMMQMLTA
jgi:hypothetical protein